jgi:hypothetical protein
MEPDEGALKEFRRAWRNFFLGYPGWDQKRVEQFIAEQIEDCSHTPLFYNNPPAFCIARELIPKNLLDRLDPRERAYQSLWQQLYDALESEGHWNFFDDDMIRCRIHDRIAQILIRWE